MKAWYFAREDGRLRYGDGRNIVVGETHKVDCEPVLCECGLHASKTVFDALGYAPGPILYRVKLDGTIVEGSDKIVATERTYLWRMDTSELLRRFARLCAQDVLHLWRAPAVVVEYLETGDESLRAAARDAAWAAAGAAARAAAVDAAGDAAWAAAGDAAWDAAWAAAGDAAGDAAWDAAWDAARDDQRKRLAGMIAAERKRLKL